MELIIVNVVRISFKQMPQCTHATPRRHEWRKNVVKLYFIKIQTQDQTIWIWVWY